MPRLEVFTKEDFDAQLKRVMQSNTNQMIHARPDNFLVRLPKVLFWIKKIKKVKTNFAQTLRSLLAQDVINNKELQEELLTVLDQIDCEVNRANCCQHLVEYDSMNWHFELRQMEANLNTVTKQIKDQNMRATAVLTAPPSENDNGSPAATAETSMKMSPQTQVEDLDVTNGLDNIKMDRGVDTINLVNNF